VKFRFLVLLTGVGDPRPVGCQTEPLTLLQSSSSCSTIVLREEDHAEWKALSAVLDAHPDDVLYQQDSWNSRDVYAHLAHWMDLSSRQFEAVMNGAAVPTVAGTDGEINARWREEDSALSLEQARTWANQEFQLESVAPDEWNERLDAIARADGADHYRAHREYIQI
jgi:hypothetical protein